MTRPHPRHQSKLTNGTRVFLGGVSACTPVGRRYADLLRELEAERGGAVGLSVTAREAVRIYAGLAVRLEQLHADIAAGKDADPEALGQLGDRLDRQARRMGPPKAPERKSLRDHLAAGGARP